MVRFDILVSTLVAGLICARTVNKKYSEYRIFINYSGGDNMENKDF